MGFIKHALIGIALYEVVKYLFNKNDLGFAHVSGSMQTGSPSRQRLREDQVDVIAGARQTDQLQQMKENAASTHQHSESPSMLMDDERPAVADSEDDLQIGTDPETPLTGPETKKDQNDPWKNSLANDELRAPDS